jgi:hypothetical protein
MAARKAAIEARKAAFAKAKANKAATQEVMTAQEVTPTPQPTAELSSSSAEASSKLCAGGSSLAQWCSSARVSNKVSTFTLSTPTLLFTVVVHFNSTIVQSTQCAGRTTGYFAKAECTAREQGMLPAHVVKWLVQ